jgi:hypothetical protein
MANKSLEVLLAETEQRILNNDFYKRFTITYEDEEYEFFAKPISQREFMQLYTRYGKKDTMKLNEEIIAKCLVHEDGSNYPEEKIEILMNVMPAGFSTEIAKCVYEVSGINTDDNNLEEAEQFLEETS